MGKGTDKLYITHSEWSSADAFSASSGSGISRSKAADVDASFRRLPFNYCALSLQPFNTPVCTTSGTVFDHENILQWLAKHGTDPTTGEALKSSDLIKLNFVKNDDGEYMDPVTFKVFTDNTHLMAIRTSGNVFAYDTIDKLNIKVKNWRDLVSDEEFTRKQLITLQDPQNLASRNLNSFKFLKEGKSAPAVGKDHERQEANIGAQATGGSSEKILKAKEAVARARAEREKATDPNRASLVQGPAKAGNRAANTVQKVSSLTKKTTPYNAATHTTGQAAASFTSTGLTPHTSAERAVVTDEEYMLKPKRVKITGYARMSTNHGDLNLELYPEFAPRAVWNFVQLAKKGSYKNLIFHRNIRNFMIQGGDPTGTGRGGQSIWGKNFVDELEGPLKHDDRGVLSMANKGKNTNSSQFFITYRATKHLDKKHTIFGKVVGGMDTLSRLEAVKGDDKDRPLENIKLLDVVAFLDPFEEFLKQRADKEANQLELEEIRKAGGTEDDKVTWTGKRIRGDGSTGATTGVGKYLANAVAESKLGALKVTDTIDEIEEPSKKKVKSGGFGNFDSW